MEQDPECELQAGVGWWWVLVARASASIKMKPILPRKFKADAFDKAFRKTEEDTSRRTVREFKKTHQTWNEQRPTWRRDLRADFTSRGWQVDTSHLIYFFLNDGTRVRYAAMTPGFRPKTRVGFIGSVAGQGGFSHLNLRDPPGPNGIDARKWDEAIAKRMTPIVVKGYEKAMRAGAKGSGHSYG